MGRPLRARRYDTDRPGLQTPRAAAGREFVILGGRPIATKNRDRAQVHETQSISATGFSSMEVLGSVAAPDLNCVVIVRHEDDGLAFAVKQGRVVGAFGTGSRGSMQTWSKAARTQELRRCREDQAGLGIAMVKMFIERCVLEHLPLIDEVGARLSIMRGDAKWVGSTLEGEHAPNLQHLLMELAREADDCSRFQPKLEPLSQYAFPAASPPEPSKGSHLQAVNDESDFGDLDDGAASEEEIVLRQVWRLCDGRTTLERLLEESLHGRAATLRALTSLQRRGCIELCPRPAVETTEAPKPAPGPVDLARLSILFPDLGKRDAAVERFIGDVPVWIADLEAAVEERDQDACVDACTALMDSAYAVAAGPFAHEVMGAMRMAHAENWAPLDAAMEGVSQAFAEAFRVLLDLRTG